MATTPVVAPESSTTQADGSTLQTFQQWNPQQWFDTNRWTLTGTQADSDYKAGMWWSDAQDMKAAVPGLLKHAQSWTNGHGQLADMQQQARTARAELAGYTGASAKANSDQLDRVDKATQARMDAVEPVPAALRNTAAIINDGFPKMQALWEKWENDRANAPQCDADTQQMQPVISNMAQSMLDSANAIMVAYKTELAPPEISSAPPSTAQNADDQTDTSGKDAAVPAGQSGTAAHISGPTTAARAGHAPGTLVTPAAAHISGPSLAGAGAGTLTPPAVHHPVMHSVTSAATTTSAAGGPSPTATSPQLAGMGAGTLTPPAPTVAGSAAAGAVAPGPVATPASAASGTAGITPIAGMAGGFAPTAGTPGRRPRDDKRDGKPATMLPLGGRTGAGRTTRAAIRPGVAKRTGSAEAAAAAGGLRGRTAEPTGTETTSTRRRTGNRRRGPENRATVQFLDEDAWQTDDSGTGVLSGKPLNEAE